MIIDIAMPEDEMYGDVSRFARETYAKKLGATIKADPDAFAYAREQGCVVGCLGMYEAQNREPLLFETYVPCAFKKISGTTAIDRRLCAEIGTRAVVRTGGFRNDEISLGLSASLLIHASARGIRYIGITANRSAQSLARALDIELIPFGEPDLSTAGKEFRENWETFFRVKQTCFGFKIQSADGCRASLAHLEKSRIFFCTQCAGST